MAVQGPLTRRVRDARAAFAAMAIPDPNDPRCATCRSTARPCARPCRVALVVDPAGRGGVAPAVASSVRQAGRWLEDAGYAVEEMEPPELGAVADLWAAIAMEDVIAALEPAAATYGDDGIKQALGLWRAVHPPRDAAARARRAGPARPAPTALGAVPRGAADRGHPDLQRAGVPGRSRPGRRRHDPADHARPDHAARGAGAGAARGLGAHRPRRRPCRWACRSPPAASARISAWTPPPPSRLAPRWRPRSTPARPRRSAGASPQ